MAFWQKKKNTEQDPKTEQGRALEEAAHHIEEVAHVLDSREGPKMVEEHTPLSRQTISVSEGWQHEITPETKVKKTRLAQRSFIHMFLLASVVFFVIALLFAGYVFYRQGNIVSSENVNLIVGTPLSVGGGEELPIEITIENKNSTDIESATLLIQFPEGTRSADNKETNLQRFRDTIGSIPTGERVSRTVKAVLYGGEKEVKRITVEFDYRVRGSNAVFSKKKDIDIELSTSPIALSVDVLKEVSGNQLFEITATLSSNSKTVIRDVLLNVQYPFGFSFVSADPQVFGSGKDVWKIGDVAPGDKKIIRIRGTLTGQDNDDRAFRFSVGTTDPTDPKKIDTVFVSAVENVSIKKPFISLDIGFDGTTVLTEDYSFAGGRPVGVNIKWKNNLPTRVADAVIEVKVKGAALDRPTISPKKGHYRSIDDTVVFDRATNEEFALLNPGDEGVASFVFSFLPASKAADQFLQNQEITFEASVRGRRMSGDVAIESLQNTMTKKVKVSSEMALSSRVSYSDGPITNWGPIPPRAEQQTRYTVTWTVTNTFNAVADAEVLVGFLPTYVRWTGVTYPPSENIKLLDNGAILWKIGDVKSYAGYVSPTREVSFQVELLPSLIQVGTAPLLVQAAELKGTDRFTNSRLTATGGAVSTNIYTDPIFKEGFNLVSP